MARSPSRNKIHAILTCLTIISLFISGCATKEKKAAVVEESAQAQQTKTSAVPSETGNIISLESEILPEQLNIIIQSNEKIQYSAYKLTDPERLVLELDNTTPGNYQSPIVVDQGIVRKVTPVFFPESNTTRIEIALDNPTEYNIVKIGEESVSVEIKNKPEEEAESFEKLMSEGAPREEATQRQEFEEASVRPDNASPTTESLLLAGKEPLKAEGEEEEFIFTEKAKKVYSGQKISLDFQKADVKNILRSLAEVSGLNIITTPEVSGTVTMRLTNVPWDQALDIILANNKLGMEQEGNIIRITTLDQLNAEKDAKIEARSKLLEEKNAKKKAEPLFTETVQISYASMEPLKANLEGLKSERGSISTDARTFTLILVDIKENLKKMKALIRILDKPTEQVSIEARIVEVSRNYSKGLGIQWGGSSGTTTNRAFPATIGVTGGGAATPSGAGNYVVNLPAATGAGAGGAIGLLLGSISGTEFLDIQLSALESAGKAKIISNPRITTKDNVEAIIESGKDIPFETTSTEGTSTEWKKATIKLQTTPHITPDGYISLRILAAKDEPDTSLTSASGVPTITTRTMTTEVLVKDGSTAVLGGLFKKNESGSQNGVPWLSKIPGLGYFFKNETELDDEEELLIFITPRILKRIHAKGESHAITN